MDAASIVVLSGLIIGLVYGAVGLLSGFCLMSSLRGFWAEGDGRLDSWKEIAGYLGREVRTVQGWEKNEGLPVHRHAWRSAEGRGRGSGARVNGCGGHARGSGTRKAHDA